MPLLKGKKNIGKNVKELIKSGKDKKQAFAISLRVAGIKKKRKEDVKLAVSITNLLDALSDKESLRGAIEDLMDDLYFSNGTEDDSFWDVAKEMLARIDSDVEWEANTAQGYLGLIGIGSDDIVELARLGSGKRFAALKAKLARRGVKDPDALAAHIGMMKHGKGKMMKMAAAGKK